MPANPIANFRERLLVVLGLPKEQAVNKDVLEDAIQICASNRLFSQWSTSPSKPIQRNPVRQRDSEISSDIEIIAPILPASIN